MNIDPKLQELAGLVVLACLGLGFAWAQDETMFAAVFATEAAWATVEVVELSFRS